MAPSIKKLDNEEKDQDAAAEEGEEEKKEPKIRVNHYKEMGLEETSIVRKIASVVGFAQLSKKSKKDGAKGGSKSKSANKSGTAKKKTGQNAAMEMATMALKQFEI